jgi:D-3-phosphoglycerate dehydrogenase
MEPAVRILVADPLSPAGIRALEERGLTVDVKTGLPEKDLVATIGAYDGLIVRSATHVNEAVLAAAKRLRVVGRAGVGVDNIDEGAATRHGVLVMNTPTGNTLSACEHTMALMLALARNVPQAHASVAAGDWDRKGFAGVELADKTLGIVGLGRIGREVATRAQGFGMRILGFDPYVSPEAARKAGIELADLDEVLAQADFVTLHTPLTEETKRLINAERIARMKPGVRLVNVARGGLIDEAALAEALEAGHVAGAALDVFETEPPKDSPLLGLKNVVLTPHLGASTAEAQEKVALQVAQQVADFLLVNKVRNATNLTHPPAPEMEPYIRLAQAIGTFAVQMAEGNPSAVVVDCRGEVGGMDAHPVAWAALVGILGRASADRVNLVNAEQKAEAFGIKVTLTQTESVEDYASSVRLTLKTDKGEVGILGTYLARLGGRIVEINGYDVEFKPTGRFLVVAHQDQPGTVAKISNVLGTNNINIAQMVVGRLAPRGQAVSILRLDDPVPQEVLAELRAVLDTPDIRVVEVPADGAGGAHGPLEERPQIEGEKD